MPRAAAAASPIGLQAGTILWTSKPALWTPLPLRIVDASSTPFSQYAYSGAGLTIKPNKSYTDIYHRHFISLGMMRRHTTSAFTATIKLTSFANYSNLGAGAFLGIEFGEWFGQGWNTQTGSAKCCVRVDFSKSNTPHWEAWKRATYLNAGSQDDSTRTTLTSAETASFSSLWLRYERDAYQGFKVWSSPDGSTYTLLGGVSGLGTGYTTGWSTTSEGATTVAAAADTTLFLATGVTADVATPPEFIIESLVISGVTP